jgi:aminoglycoside 6'-N-acetyltransferase
MLCRLTREDVDPYIVEAGEELLGYLQAWFGRLPGESNGLDMFLIAGARGRGLGPDAARALAEHLDQNGHTPVTADPYLWNKTAIRAFAKAGFHHVEESDPEDEHISAWLLMVFDRQL